MTTFDSTKTELEKLLEEIFVSKIELQDSQRGWVWDRRTLQSSSDGTRPEQPRPGYPIALILSGGFLAHD